MILAMLAFIPSPRRGVINLGPVPIRAYGILIAVAVLVAVHVAGRRWEAKGGPPGAMATIAAWAVPFGLVGARAYHVATDAQLFYGRWLDVFKVWEGGLGIWGAVAGGAAGALVAARRHGWALAPILDAAAPAVPLGQAIGRFGNWFNQELFGRPTGLAPWS